MFSTFDNHRKGVALECFFFARFKSFFFLVLVLVNGCFIVLYKKSLTLGSFVPPFAKKILVAEKSGELKKLENLVQNQSI